MMAKDRKGILKMLENIPHVDITYNDIENLFYLAEDQGWPDVYEKTLKLLRENHGEEALQKHFDKDLGRILAKNLDLVDISIKMGAQISRNILTACFLEMGENLDEDWINMVIDKYNISAETLVKAIKLLIYRSRFFRYFPKKVFNIIEPRLNWQQFNELKEKLEES